MVTYSIPPDLLLDARRASEQSPELKKYLKFSLAVATGTAIKRAGMLGKVIATDSQDFAVLMYVASFFDVMMCQDKSGALSDANKAFLRKFNRVLMRYMFTVDEIVAKSKAVWDQLCTTDCMSEEEIRELMNLLPGLLSDGLRHHEYKLIAFMQGILSHPAMVPPDNAAPNMISAEAIRNELQRVQAALPRLSGMTEKAALKILGGVPDFLQPVVDSIRRDGDVSAHDMVAPESRKDFKVLIKLYKMAINRSAASKATETSVMSPFTDDPQITLNNILAMPINDLVKITDKLRDAINNGDAAQIRQILNLPKTATQDDVKTWYKKIISRIHPDKLLNIEGDRMTAIEELGKVINTLKSYMHIFAEDAVPTSRRVSETMKSNEDRVYILDLQDSIEKELERVTESSAHDILTGVPSDGPLRAIMTHINNNQDVKLADLASRESIDALDEADLKALTDTLSTLVSVYENAKLNARDAMLLPIRNMLKKELERVHQRSAYDVIFGVPDGPLRTIMTRLKNNKDVSLADLGLYSFDAADQEDLEEMLSKLIAIYNAHIETSRNVAIFMTAKHQEVKRELERVKTVAPPSNPMSVEAARAIMLGVPKSGILNAIRRYNLMDVTREDYITKANTSVNTDNIRLHSTPEEMVKHMKELKKYYKSANNVLRRKVPYPKLPFTEGPDYSEGAGL